MQPSKISAMVQYRRAFVPGGTFFFTLVTSERKPILTSPSSRILLRNAFRHVRSQRPFEMLAIVLLPDHLHTIWQLPPGDSDYSTRWRLIKTHFSRAYASTNDSENLAGRVPNELKVWQRRFYEHSCQDEADVERCFDYVHINPLKHGLVKRVRDWRWSTFHRYVDQKHYDIDWGGDGQFFGDEFKNYE